MPVIEKGRYRVRWAVTAEEVGRALALRALGAGVCGAGPGLGTPDQLMGYAWLGLFGFAVMLVDRRAWVLWTLIV